MGISLSEKDKSHLEKFKNAIHYTGEVKTYFPLKLKKVIKELKIIVEF